MSSEGNGSSTSKVVRCRTVAMGRLHQVHHIRDIPTHPHVTDPSSMSAVEAVPDALELLLSAFGSCLAAGIHANAIARQIAVKSLALELEGQVDPAMHWGTASEVTSLGFEAITVAVHIEADASEEALTALLKHATLWSPVANTLYNPVHLKVSLAG